MTLIKKQHFYEVTLFGFQDDWEGESSVCVSVFVCWWRWSPMTKITHFWQSNSFAKTIHLFIFKETSSSSCFGVVVIAGNLGTLWCSVEKVTIWSTGREPWSSGYGRILVFWRLWVRIPAPYTGWTFFHLFVVIIVMFVWKDEKHEKEAEDGPLKKQFEACIFKCYFLGHVWFSCLYLRMPLLTTSLWKWRSRFKE